MKQINTASRVLAACLVMGLAFLGLSLVPAKAVEDIIPFEVNARSAVLMDQNTGTVLYAKNADKALPPASVTKVMTLLLVMEAIDSGTLSLSETIPVSEYAASMGGSQVFLKPGEVMSAEEMLKCVVVASANDAAVALAERIAGSEEAFVVRMNERALELGMQNTHFENVTGLDDDTTDHMTSAYDIALMSRELLKHPKILEFSGIWMDTIRDGAFGLTNTNRLIRFYKGATGLKTGSTSKARFCISATAEREGLHLIAVIMGSDTRDTRNAAAQSLLDWGFANFSIYQSAGGEAGAASVIRGTQDFCRGETAPLAVLLPRGKEKHVSVEQVLYTDLSAPIQVGNQIGVVRYWLEEEILTEIPITAVEEVPEIGFLELLTRMWSVFFLHENTK